MPSNMPSNTPSNTHRNSSKTPIFAKLLLACSLLYLAPAPPANAWFLSIDGAVAPLTTPFIGRVKVGGGGVINHFMFEASVSNIPAKQVILYEGMEQETIEDYPTFIGVEGRYYFLAPIALTKRHDLYMSLGVDFPIVEQSFIPAVKVGGGYALKVHRRVVWEIGADYYFYGALTNALYVGSGIKVVF